ncbi:MAG: Holliday junction resolvase-like protein, partial [Candidatus Absconditicoccaceae bacterium]
QFKMQQNIPLIIICIIIGLIIGYLIAKIYFQVKIKGQRQEAVSRSRSVLLGNVNEKIAPLLPNFPYYYKDMVFVGKGIDYVVFNGLSAGTLKNIIFLEIKSGTSTLNRNERMIKECTENKKVYYDIYNIKN